jgi:hypothetical protein
MSAADPLKDVQAGLLSNDGALMGLASVHVRGELVDMVARCTLFQLYTNSGDTAVEAKYVFPLDETASVCGFEAFIGEKHIVAVVKEKEEASRRCPLPPSTSVAGAERNRGWFLCRAPPGQAGIPPGGRSRRWCIFDGRGREGPERVHGGRGQHTSPFAGKTIGFPGGDNGGGRGWGPCCGAGCLFGA